MTDMQFDWKAGCLHDFQYAGMSYQELATKYGRAKITIQKFLQREGAKRVNPQLNKGGRIKYADLPTLSSIHKNIGVKLNLHRTVSMKENLTEFSSRLSVNRDTLRRMELGVHDFTLSELTRVSQMLSSTPIELLTPKKEIYAG